VRIPQQSTGLILTRRSYIYISVIAAVAACALALLSRFHLVMKGQDYGFYGEDGLIVITTLGETTSPPMCLVVNPVGKPVANFIIAGDGVSNQCYFKTDEHGRAEIILAISVRIGDIDIDMRGVRSIVAVLRAQ
jgi:hypothetical protein